MSWPMVKLGDVAPSKPLKNPNVKDAENVWQLNLDKVESNSGKVIEKVYQPLNEAGSSTHWFGDEHVLYSKLRPYLNKVVIPDEQGLATTELVPLLPDSNRLDRKFLAYYLRSSGFVQWISEQVAGAKMPRVSMEQFWNHEIPLPPLAEQKRIAAILDKADAIRRKRQQAIQLADDFLRAVFLEMFGDPVTNPKGWEVRPFSYIGNWSSGGTPSRSSPQFFNGAINWYSAGELNSRYLSGSVEKITKDAVAKSAAKVFPAGSMLLGMYDTAAFKLSILSEESACNQACANVIPNDTVDIEWLYSYLSYAKEHYLKARRGVRQKNLNLGMIKEFELPLPPKKEQERFTALVLATNKKLESASRSSEACSSLFDSLSARAFSGQL